jgi:hypothetical protein
MPFHPAESIAFDAYTQASQGTSNFNHARNAVNSWIIPS